MELGIGGAIRKAAATSCAGRTTVFGKTANRISAIRRADQILGSGGGVYRAPGKHRNLYDMGGRLFFFLLRYLPSRHAVEAN